MTLKQEESLKGLFYIVRGQYSKKSPSVTLEGDTKYIGGYDPTDDQNTEWYQVKDNITHYCICSGGSLDKALKYIEDTIKKYKTRKEYFRHLSKTTSEDYYEVHYLNRPPLTREQRQKKVIGRCPRVSPSQKLLEREIFNAYGDYYSDLIEKAEDNAYKFLEENSPRNRGRKLSVNPKKRNGVTLKPAKPKKEPQQQTAPKRQLIQPRRNLLKR